MICRENSRKLVECYFGSQSEEAMVRLSEEPAMEANGCYQGRGGGGVNETPSLAENSISSSIHGASKLHYLMLYYPSTCFCQGAKGGPNAPLDIEPYSKIQIHDNPSEVTEN